MFDEFKKVKYSKEIKGLKSLQVKVEAYLEHKQTSMMKFLWIKLTAYYFCNKSSIINEWLGYI